MKKEMKNTAQNTEDATQMPQQKTAEMMLFEMLSPVAAAVLAGDADGANTALDAVFAWEEPLPLFSRVCTALSLSRRDACLLAVCAVQQANGEQMPNGVALARYAAKLGGAPSERIASALHPEGAILPLVLAFLWGNEPVLPPWVRVVFTATGTVYHHKELLETLYDPIENALAQQLPLAIALTGAKGLGRAFLAGQLAEHAGFGTVYVETDKVQTGDVPWICTLANLWNCAICLRDAQSAGLSPLLEAFFARTNLLFFTAEDFHGVGGAFAVLARSVSPLTPVERHRALTDCFGDWVDAELLTQTANLYRFNMQWLMALASRLQGEAATGAITNAQFSAALRSENGAALRKTATLLQSNQTFADIILPAAQMNQLTAVRDCVRNRETVYRDWGFAEKIPYGRGVATLFYGASGTGKTLAATALANELGLPLYRVDLSQLTSKYVGDTQKNIGKIFDEAQNSDCILFFDEADALFSRRSDGGDANDKHINGEIAYLLQRTESYDGVMILATNLLQNFDDAFRRRIQYMIHFPLPDTALRHNMWQRIFPAAAPCEGLDAMLLANELELSCASIRNIALSAAYLAASEAHAIDTETCVRAARGEYAKQGKPFPQRLDSFYPQERR